jgi:peptide/nickel transport system substrate-binding protein
VMLDPSINRMSYEVFRINGKPFQVSKLDDATIRVVTPEVFAPFLEFFGTVAILPQHRFEAAIREKRFPVQYAVSVPPESIVGSGPFRLKQFKAGQYALFERDPEYWVADTNHQRLPYLKTVRVLAGGTLGADVSMFLNGKTDAYENVRPEMFPNFLTVSAKTGFKLIDIGLGVDREFFWFNQNTNVAANGTPLVNPAKVKWFRNKKFRQAVSCAIDRERIARDVYFGRAQPIYAFISSENLRWNNTNVARYAYDPAKARSLLAEIGISQRGTNAVATDADGNAVEITFISNLGNPLRAKACQMIVEDLAKVGIKLVYSPMAFELLQQTIDRDFNYECALIGLGGGAADPSSQLNVLKSSEPLHQWFPLQPTPSTPWEARIDELMDQQLRTLDFAQRKRAFDEVQTILAEELPMIYTTSPIACSAVRTNLANLRPATITPFRVTWNIEELYLR